MRSHFKCKLKYLTTTPKRHTYLTTVATAVFKLIEAGHLNIIFKTLKTLNCLQDGNQELFEVKITYSSGTAQLPFVFNASEPSLQIHPLSLLTSTLYDRKDGSTLGLKGRQSVHVWFQSADVSRTFLIFFWFPISHYLVWLKCTCVFYWISPTL